MTTRPFSGSDDEQDRKIQVEETKQSHMLTKFFGQIKPKVRGTGPIHDQFPESFSIYSWNVNGISS